MGTIVFTRSFVASTSTAVDEVYYNDNTNELYLDLRNKVYKYSQVPAAEFEALEKVENEGGSVGSAYATQIKPHYGPSDFVGEYPDTIEYEEVDVDESVDSDPEGFNVASAPLAALTVNPGSVYVAPVINTGPVSLTPFGNNEAPESVKYKHAVVFEINGERKVYNTEAGNSVMESIEALSEIGAMLDLDFDVKEVTVSFE